MTHYCRIWLRGVKGIFTWETAEEIFIGGRAEVMFRNRKKTGIVVDISPQKPTFKTKPIVRIWDTCFIDPRYVALAKTIAKTTRTPFEKVLSLLIPEKFLIQKTPVIRERFYYLTNTGIKEAESFRGKKQRLCIERLQKKEYIPESLLRKDISLTTLNTLIEKKIIAIKEGDIQSISTKERKSRPSFDLTPDQQKAFDTIQKSSKPSVLFGVTGSGKTEVYKKLAISTVQDGDSDAQILFLLPEIALTSQLIAEFYDVFGDRLAVWHSKLSEGEKIQEWERCRTGAVDILIGTRSALFVPLKNPKLIILDEEHEWTFKNEFSPRYWTHSVVEDMHNIFNAKLVFGSATPRLESLLHCQKEEWTRVDLKKRVHDVQMPSIQIIDLKNERKKGNDSPLSESLEYEIEQMLLNQKQGMLFLNKRGFSGATFCQSCGHTFECPQCSQNMKMHQKGTRRRFICHVCGHMESFPEKCPDCGTSDFIFRGWGTQMVESHLREVFPGIRIFRADADSVSGKNDFEILMDRFHNYEADLLLGTQMIAKGLDFERVNLVGVILADVGLSLPDFRAEERVFQLLTQVSGRAGRRKEQGKIIIQTFHSDDPLFEFVCQHNTEGFLRSQSEKRFLTHMPPFYNIVKITYSHTEKKEAFRRAQEGFQELKKQATECEVFFAPAFFPRTHNNYHFHVFVKSEKRDNIFKALNYYKEATSGVRIDIDPVSLL